MNANTESITLEANNEASPASKRIKLAQIMRWLGGIAVAGAALRFIFADLQQSGPVTQYSAFLAFTAILTAFGWFCSIRWKDAAGGRTLLGLGAAFLPAAFGQLSGLIYAGMGGTDTTLQVGLIPTLILTGISLPVLAMGSSLGMAALCRPHAKLLAIGYFLANALLLVPVRSPEGIATLAVAGFIGVVAMFAHIPKRGGLGLRTLDGLMARFAFLTCFGILFGRNIVHHSVDVTLVCAMLALPAIFLTTVLPYDVKGRRLRNISFILGSLLGFFSLITAAAEVLYRFELMSYLSGESYIALFIVLFLGLVYATSWTVGGRELNYARGTVASLALLALIIELIYGFTFPVAIAGAAAGIGSLVFGWSVREKALITVGGLAFAASAIALLAQIISLNASFHWGWLGVIGVLAIVGSSWIEKDKQRICRAIASLRTSWCEWN